MNPATEREGGFLSSQRRQREGEERESARARKMNRMSWHRPLTALSLCPIKAVIYDHVSSMCDADSITLTVHSHSTKPGGGKTPNLEMNVLRFLVLFCFFLQVNRWQNMWQNYSYFSTSKEKVAVYRHDMSFVLTSLYLNVKHVQVTHGNEVEFMLSELYLRSESKWKSFTCLFADH